MPNELDDAGVVSGITGMALLERLVEAMQRRCVAPKAAEAICLVLEIMMIVV